MKLEFTTHKFESFFCGGASPSSKIPNSSISWFSTRNRLGWVLYLKIVVSSFLVHKYTQRRCKTWVECKVADCMYWCVHKFTQEQIGDQLTGLFYIETTVSIMYVCTTPPKTDIKTSTALQSVAKHQNYSHLITERLKNLRYRLSCVIVGQKRVSMLKKVLPCLAIIKT